jgi:multiple sugar transport system substrate-binding protein
MKRRLTVLAAAAALATLGLTACGSSGGGTSSGTTAANPGGGGTTGATSAPVTLKLLGADYGTGPQNSTTKYWQNIADAFHQANPSITVDVSTINWTDYDTKVKTQIQNHEFPDILQGEFFPQYVNDDLLAPVSDIVSDPSMGISTFKNQFSVDGTQYALPFTTSARAMFYNKQLFAKAHISSPPQTWAELESDAKKLKAAGVEIPYALPLGPEEAQAESFLWMLGNGGGWQNAQGKYDINSPQNVETFEFLKKLVSEGLTNPSPATYNRTADSAADFSAGKVGMQFNGPFLTATIAAAGKLKTSDYATAAVPGKNGPLNKTLGVADAIQVFKTDDANKAAAIKKFMDYAMNNKNQLEFAKEYALLPGTQSAADTLKNDPVLGAFIKALPNTVTFPTDANWTATVLPAIKQLIGTAVTGDPKSVLDQLQAKAES